MTTAGRASAVVGIAVVCAIACSTPRDVAVSDADGGARDGATDLSVPVGGAIAAGGEAGAADRGGNGGDAAGEGGSVAGMAGTGGAVGTGGASGAAGGGAGGMAGAQPDGTGVASISNEGASVSPEPGKTTITIKFTEAVDRAATEASYQSTDVQKAKLKFTWIDDQTVDVSLVETIPFTTGLVTDPATRIRMTITVRTKAGQTLPSRTWEFTTWRYVTLDPPFAPDLSGRIGRSGMTYLQDGKLSVGGTAQYRAFVTFDLTGLPVVKEVRELNVRLYQTSVAGSYDGAIADDGRWTAWSSFGALYDLATFNHAATLTPQTATTEWKSARIDAAGAALLAPAAASNHVQFRVKSVMPASGTAIEFDTAGATAPQVVVAAWVI